MPAVVFTPDMWHTDVLFNRVIHSPGDQRDRQRERESEMGRRGRETEIPLSCSFMQERKSIIEVSQPMHLKNTDFKTPTSNKIMRKRCTC